MTHNLWHNRKLFYQLLLLMSPWSSTIGAFIMLERLMTANPPMNMGFVATVKQCFDGSNVNHCMLVTVMFPDLFQLTACCCSVHLAVGIANQMVCILHRQHRCYRCSNCSLPSWWSHLPFRSPFPVRWRLPTCCGSWCLSFSRRFGFVFAGAAWTGSFLDLLSQDSRSDHLSGIELRDVSFGALELDFGASALWTWWCC